MDEPPVLLEEFIEGSILQIMRAISRAAPEVAKLGGALNPRPYGEGTELAQAGVVRRKGGGSLTYIDFDVAVTTSKEAGKKGGLAVVFPVISGGGTGHTVGKNEAVSRISFRVPVGLPSTG